MIRIYQINHKRDKYNIAFMGTGMIEKLCGLDKIDFSIYDLVYEGNPEYENLDDIFEMFNLNHPKGYKGHSLSVSDIVEVVGKGDLKDGYWFCDNFGWTKIEF